MPTRPRMPSAPITRAPFEEPYQNPVQPFAQGGLNLRDAEDSIEPQEYLKLTNVDAFGVGRLRARWGQQEEATSGGTHVHSIARLDDPLGNQSTRLWGIDTSLYHGFSGALASIDTGYSGDPLHLVPKRPDFSGHSWMYVADRSRMRKVRFDGLDLPIGLPKPAVPTTALVTEETTPILEFDSDDSSDAPTWTKTVAPGFTAAATTSTQMFDAGGAFAALPTKSGAGFIGMTVIGPSTSLPVPEGQADPWAFWAKALTLDLSNVGARPADDEDQIHFWIAFAKASLVIEFRIYFVTGAGAFVPTELPGRSESANQNAFVKVFRPSEIVRALTAESRITDAYTQESPILGSEDFLRQTETDANFSSASADTSQPPLIPLNIAAGQFQWAEFGAIGRPLKRGSFYKIGSPDWSQVTGVILFVRSDGSQNGGGGVFLDDMYLTGGYGPDSSDPAATKYDIRVTHFDTRTGTEGNPSDEQDESLHLDALRRGITVTPAAAYGDADIRQRVYVRGGFATADWFRAGENTADGGAFTVEITDAELQASATLELDHDEPVTSQDSNGDAILAQPVPVLIDLGDLLIAFGDPNRPGHIYWPIPGEFGHWPPQNTDELCPPSEELIGGVAWGGQAYIFSRKRLFIVYRNLAEPGSVVSTNTPCSRGLHSRWAVCVGERGIYAVDIEGIFVTSGGAPTEIADKLYPLFHRESSQGYDPINMSAFKFMRLVAANGRIFFMYQDTGGVNHVAVYDERREIWRGIWTFGREVGTIAVEPHESGTIHIVPMILGGRTSGEGYMLSDAAYSDDGVAIPCTVHTARWDGGIQRENKQLGDAILDLDPDLTAVTAQFFLNQGTVANATQTVPATADGRQRYILDAFGTVPQFAKTAELEVTWSSANRRPELYEWGISHIPIPEETNRRATQWDDLGSANEKYVTGFMLEVDTFNTLRPFTVEYDLGGVINAVADISPQASVTSDGRHRWFFSWPAVKANLVRIRPDDACAPWILFKVAWEADPEPARIARVDSNFEEHYDTYYTGLDLIIDTLGLTKTFEVYVDGQLLNNPQGGTTFAVSSTGKQVRHLSFGPGYGHIYRYRATDDNDCLLYSHRWFLAPQPSEQHNLNQGYTVAGTRADKWCKGVILEIDTFGQVKTITVEVDHVVHESFTVTTSGRQVIQHAFDNGQVRGRVTRIYSTDGMPARVWPPIEGIFDIEPLALQRVETQEITHGIDGWQTVVLCEVCYRSTAAVTLAVTTIIGDDGTSVTDTYASDLPSTGDAKQKRKVFFTARKGLLFKYVFTCSADFYLYREESEAHVRPWGRDGIAIVKPFGNDAMDADRGMRMRSQDADVPPTEPMSPPVPTAP